MSRKRSVKCILSVLTAAAVMSSFCGCSSENNGKLPENKGVENMMQAGRDLSAAEPGEADDNWYRKESVYTDDNGRRLKVLCDDEGMLEFFINRLSMHYTTVNKYRQENNWKIYTCDDGTVIIYYPGDPAHLEISDGEYAGLYKAAATGCKIRTQE